MYGGPHAQTVVAAPSAYLLQQWIADHGFIIVSVDGRGTPARGRSWERALKGNLIDIPLGDQVAGLKALGRKYRELDLDRVGIYGWSFGGYFSAIAVMRRPDVFDVGVAGAPVAEWLDYDTHYTERYLGMPDEEVHAYARYRLLDDAPNLSRPLMLIHGIADDNVYVANTLQLSRCLMEAGRPHTVLPLSGITHAPMNPQVAENLLLLQVRFIRDALGLPDPT